MTNPENLRTKFDCLDMAKNLLPNATVDEVIDAAERLYNFCSKNYNFCLKNYNLSKIHQNFSNYLRQPEALTNPEKYLGPNYQDVLDFWFYIEGLSDEERKEMSDRYQALDDNVRFSAWNAARHAADAVVGWEFRSAAWWAACYVTGKGVFGEATEELIAYHKLKDHLAFNTINHEPFDHP
jgi:hypothetical protein